MAQIEQTCAQHSKISPWSLEYSTAVISSAYSTERGWCKIKGVREQTPEETNMEEITCSVCTSLNILLQVALSRCIGSHVCVTSSVTVNIPESQTDLLTLSRVGRIERIKK